VEDSTLRSSLALLLLLAAAPALAKPPIWDRKIDSPKRFKVLKAFDSEAALDQETGLVWALAPLATAHPWLQAGYECNTASIGGRGGWRLPSLAEFSSIVDPGTNLLPEGNPFAIPLGSYWTATASSATDAFLGNITEGAAVPETSKAADRLAWCVRGGLGAGGNIP
jgi:hypothetical protein